MRFDLDVAQHQLSWPDLLDRARYAQDTGFHGAWVFDHFKPLYGDPSGPCMEAWTLLAALAASTERDGRDLSSSVDPGRGSGDSGSRFWRKA